MKGKKAQLKAPGALKPGEWTFEASERAFYLRIAGDPAEARVEAPYRRNGVTVRAPKVAATHVIVRNLMSLPDVICLEGGLPLMRGGQQVGAIGVSGLKAFEDGVVAAAGAAALDP